MSIRINAKKSTPVSEIPWNEEEHVTKGQWSGSLQIVNIYKRKLLVCWEMGLTQKPSYRVQMKRKPFGQIGLKLTFKENGKKENNSGRVELKNYEHGNRWSKLTSQAGWNWRAPGLTTEPGSASGHHMHTPGPVYVWIHTCTPTFTCKRTRRLAHLSGRRQVINVVRFIASGVNACINGWVLIKLYESRLWPLEFG